MSRPKAHRGAAKAALEFWSALSREDRGAVGDQLVLGEFDWRDWLHERPPPGFARAVDDLRIIEEENDR